MAFSFQVATADQAETDRYWNAIVGNGGEENACGWYKDQWGLSWQITPIALTQAITDYQDAALRMSDGPISIISVPRLRGPFAFSQISGPRPASP